MFRKIDLIILVDNLIDSLIILSFITWIYGWYLVIFDDQPNILMYSSIIALVLSGISLGSSKRKDIEIKLIVSKILKEIKYMEENDLKSYYKELFIYSKNLHEEEIFIRLLHVIEHKAKIN